MLLFFLQLIKATNTICCRQRPVGEFWNNTVHSVGKYGLWVFVELNPTGPNGDCGESEPMAMKIGEIPDYYQEDDRDSIFGLYTWGTERGAEIATGGAIQFHNMVASDNWIAGLAGKETHLSTYGLGNTQAFIRSIIIGRTMAHPELEFCGLSGLETPWEMFAFTVHDMHFFNFDQPSRKLTKAEFAMANELANRPCMAVNPCYGSDAFDCGATIW